MNRAYRREQPGVSAPRCSFSASADLVHDRSGGRTSHGEHRHGHEGARCRQYAMAPQLLPGGCRSQMSPSSFQRRRRIAFQKRLPKAGAGNCRAKISASFMGDPCHDFVSSPGLHVRFGCSQEVDKGYSPGRSSTAPDVGSAEALDSRKHLRCGGWSARHVTSLGAAQFIPPTKPFRIFFRAFPLGRPRPCGDLRAVALHYLLPQLVRRRPAQLRRRDASPFFSWWQAFFRLPPILRPSSPGRPLTEPNKAC